MLSWGSAWTNGGPKPETNGLQDPQIIGALLQSTLSNQTKSVHHQKTLLCRRHLFKKTARGEP